MGALSNHLDDLSKSGTNLLLTGGQWGCLRVWHPQTGRCLLEIKGPLDRTPVVSSDSQNTILDRQAIEYGLHSIVSLKIFNVRADTADGDESMAADSMNSILVPKLILTRQSNHVEFYDPLVAKLTSEVCYFLVIFSHTLFE